MRLALRKRSIERRMSFSRGPGRTTAFTRRNLRWTLALALWGLVASLVVILVLLIAAIARDFWVVAIALSQP
jgi:hypothetical protein